MMKCLTIILAAIISFAADTSAQMIPTGYNSWYRQDDPAVHAVEFGGELCNYWDGASWRAIDSRFYSAVNGYRSIANRHFVHVDTLADIVRFAMAGYDGRAHILRTKIGPLFLLNRITLDTVRLASPNLSGYSVAGDMIRIGNVYPGVNCLIWNRKGGLEHRFVFSPAADTFIFNAWNDAGRDTNIFTVNTFRIFADSLQLDWQDDDGPINIDLGRQLDGNIDLNSDGKFLFSMPRGAVRSSGHVNPDSTNVPLYRRIVRSGNQLWLFEGLRNSDIASWPRLGFEHNDSRNWSRPHRDTYISKTSPSTSYYPSQLLSVYGTSFGGQQTISLLRFDRLIDSLNVMGAIDSALLQLHYSSGVISQGRARVCRGIADKAWADSGAATWNSKYDGGSDSVSWAAGWGNHSLSFTTTNSAQKELKDTSSTGYYQFPIKDMLNDVKNAGVDFGFWIDSGTLTVDQRTVFDSNEDLGADYPKLYIQYTTANKPLRRRHLLKGGKFEL